MAYESKVIFKAVYDILETSKDLEEAKKRVARIANVNGEEDVIRVCDSETAKMLDELLENRRTEKNKNNSKEE